MLPDIIGRRNLMSHHHDHDHKHDQHHPDHGHSDQCGHHHDSDSLSFEQKMSKLLEHWLKHNNDHVLTYREWSRKAKDKGLGDMSAILEDIAAASSALNQKFEAAAGILKK
jgi:hypothetical protein